MRNKYAYRLLGLNDDWVNVDANDRKATYTNLNPGDYRFQLKASNKDGIWNQTPKEIEITVYPAPWLSKWAFMTYFVAVILSIWAFIRYKTLASRKRAQQLETTVTERTHEVNLQKKMVESLLDHKNEVFANVTHEFKTPLALILGPIELLAKEPELHKHQDSLNMIQRNAKRLFLMVGQILKLSQAEANKEIMRESQSVQATLTMLYESFKPLAQNKNIKLSIDNNHQVNVYTTPECLEIVVGNLLSNALKFTNSNGEIKLSSKLANKQISIHVKDTGSGIDKKYLDKIFQRFIRLDTHKSIQGTGIGLSVVKEITRANNGEVTVSSELGQGTEFIVSFATTEIDAIEELSQAMVDQMVDNTENEISITDKNIESKSDSEKNHVTVLIIEDNLDMQKHIGNVLKQRFNCLFADRGTKGIALALQEVPDIVICDVMMPGMDGYQVTRILRHDGRTSHIPIILLTALNTKESRIKGWRENIDVYVTKPFDATELNVQLDNILTIRKILQKNTNKALKTNKSLGSLDLPKQDQDFIEKFKDIIANHYHNEYFQKADLASKMAISERQLQRKIKALIGENPMDAMRDYRLEKAAMKLKDGYQVSLVSDQCGFGSVSYFGKCFKQKYGVTPKKYQQIGKTSS
jgi:signal transduction histidine kinase/DNA-binding response OmpR family regulator